MKLQSQRQQILDHLHAIDPTTNDTRGISAFEALGLYRCHRLAARIGELRDSGIKITSIKKKDRTGLFYARYFLSSNKSCYLQGSVYSMPRNRR